MRRRIKLNSLTQTPDTGMRKTKWRKFFSQSIKSEKISKFKHKHNIIKEKKKKSKQTNNQKSPLFKFTFYIQKKRAPICPFKEKISIKFKGIVNFFSCHG